MTHNAGPDGTSLGTPVKPTSRQPLNTEKLPSIAQRKSAPRKDNVFIPVSEGGQRPSNFWRAWRFGKELKVNPSANPVLSDKDNALHNKYWEGRLRKAEAEIEANEVDRLILRLQLLVAHGVRGVFAVANGKSAGKTRTTQIVLATIQRYTGCQSVGLTATLNNATATLGRMSDIEPGAQLPVERFIKMIDTLTTSTEISGAIPRTRADHVGIIGEGRLRANERSGYNTPDFVKTVLELVPAIDFLGLDLGNDSVQDGSVPLWAVRLAHALGFVFDPNDAVTTGTFTADVAAYRSDEASGGELDQALIERVSVQRRHAESLRSSIEEVRADQLNRATDPDARVLADAVANANLDFVAKVQAAQREERVALTGLSTPTPEKVTRATIICNRTGSADDGLVSRLMGNQPDQVQWTGVATALPTEPWFQGQTPDHEPNPTILDELTPATRRAGLEIAVALLEQMATAQRITMPDTYKNRPPVVVDYSK